MLAAMRRASSATIGFGIRTAPSKVDKSNPMVGRGLAADLSIWHEPSCARARRPSAGSVVLREGRDSALGLLGTSTKSFAPFTESPTCN